MNLVLLDAQTLGETDLTPLTRFGKIEIYDQTGEAEKFSRIRDKEIVITNKTTIDSAAMDQAPQLKLICVAATGLNNVDLDYAAFKNIQVKNVSGYSTRSVAQATFAMLFHLLHQNAYYDNYVKSGAYAQSPIFTHIGRPFWELHGKQFGIIGLGAIGRQAAELATAFGCNVSYYSTSGANVNPAYHRFQRLDELLAVADVVSIHAPLNQRTHNLIQYDQIRRMKPSAYLINAGRGGIVNEADLAKALDESLIAGAALDVLEREPILPDHPLLRVRNPEKLFITPHMAWTSIEARQTLIERVCQNIEEFLKER